MDYQFPDEGALALRCAALGYRGLEYLEAHCNEWEVTSLAVPALGCGLGQLEWRVVGPILYRHLSTLEIPVELFAPSDETDEEVTAGVLGGS